METLPSEHRTEETEDSLEGKRLERIQAVNFWTFAVYWVLTRMSWVFKTESVVLPAFLDTLGATASIRGLLPILGRLGNSLPQYLLAQHLHQKPCFKATVAWTTFAQAIPWLVLAGWLLVTPDPTGVGGMTLFLTLYSVFWIINGISLLAEGTLQGKVIAVNRRGRLLTLSNLIGCLLAIAVLLVWMLPVLRRYPNSFGFALVFVASGVLFLATAACVLMFQETPSVVTGHRLGLKEQLTTTRKLVTCDRHFRRLLTVVSMFYMILALFPHFASLGIAHGGGGISDLVFWVIAQNAGTAVASLLAGPVVDRRGNRLVLQCLLAALGAAPLLAILLTTWWQDSARACYWVVFSLVGITPVTQRTLVNYVLELAPQTGHTQYLTTLNLWQLAPLLMAPLIGMLIDTTSFAVAFGLGSAVLFAAALLAGTLAEPRDLDFLPWTDNRPSKDGHGYH